MSNVSFKGQQFDYIITGAGCAGLSFLVHLIRSGQFSNKKILLVDREEKTRNDRTWCFWETKPGPFETLVFKQWQKAWFYGEQYSGLLQLPPYTYKLIRGEDFYRYCFELIREQSNIRVVTGNVEKIISNEQETIAVINGQSIPAKFIFNSILFEKPVIGKHEYYLLQHFKGWVIETEHPVFDPAAATLMDFRVPQTSGTTFAYVMPFTNKQALVEYTLFTDNLLKPGAYDEGLRQYIREFISKDSYSIREEETGVIPMTNYRFPSRQHNIVNIGTAGGQTKASSGYTFRFIQQQAAALIRSLVQTGNPFIADSRAPARFYFYDSVLLNILYHKNHLGKKIFTDLFKKNKPQQVLRFLDNESSWKDELKIISSLPTWPFLKAAFNELTIGNKQ